jgi:hypothetical protein
VIVVRFSKRRLAVLLPLLPALDLKSGKVVAHDPRRRLEQFERRDDPGGLA